MVAVVDYFWDQSRRYDLLLIAISEHNYDGVGVSEGSQVYQNEEQQRWLSEPARVCKLHCSLFLSEVIIHSQNDFHEQLTHILPGNM